MRRITLWLLSTVAAVVLLFSYRTSTNSAGAATTVAAVPQVVPTSQPSSPASSPVPSGSKSASSSASATSSGPKTYTGVSAPTRWGDVQVTITVTDGKITDVAVPVYPSDNHKDQEINAYALPVLRQETLEAQSADIDTVSGATVTSDGYIESLQAALDAAHQ